MQKKDLQRITALWANALTAKPEVVSFLYDLIGGQTWETSIAVNLGENLVEEFRRGNSERAYPTMEGTVANRSCTRSSCSTSVPRRQSC